MKYTKNFNFKKPEPLDTVNIDDINDSFDLIDEELKRQKDNNDTMLNNERERILKEKERIKNEENRVAEFDTIKNDYETYKNVMIAESNVAALQNEINKTNSQLADMTTNFTNAKNPILTPTYDGSYQAMHPKVLYFPNGWGTGSWRYWMAMTPYTGTNDDFENPSILVSQTGKEFVVPNGLTNPIDKPTDADITAGAHMSDTHLVMVNNTMECWYRYNPGNGSGSPNNSIEKIYKKTSTDGVNWSAPILVLDLTGTQTLSPAVIYEDNKYKLWFIRYANMYYMESVDSITWSNPVKCTVPRNIYDLWHVDIIKSDLGYEAVISCYKTVEGPAGKQYLFYTKSIDGMTWEEIKMIIAPSDEYIAWDNKLIYRSSILKIGNLYKIYYSATRTGGQWYIGLTEGYSIDTLRGHDINTFYDNVAFWNNINVLDDKQITVGKKGTNSILTKLGLLFADNAGGFFRNLIHLVNQGIAGVKLKVETDVNTLAVRTDADDAYGNVKVNSVAFKGTNYQASIIASTTNADTVEVTKTGSTAHANMKLNSINLTYDSVAIAKEGTIAWNKNTHKPMYYNGTSWVDIP